jgi:hypothetical protein
LLGNGKRIVNLDAKVADRASSCIDPNEQILAGSLASEADVVVDALSALIGQFEPKRAGSTLLTHSGLSANAQHPILQT